MLFQTLHEGTDVPLLAAINQFTTPAVIKISGVVVVIVVTVLVAWVAPTVAIL